MSRAEYIDRRTRELLEQMHCDLRRAREPLVRLLSLRISPAVILREDGTVEWLRDFGDEPAFQNAVLITNQVCDQIIADYERQIMELQGPWLRYPVLQR